MLYINTLVRSVREYFSGQIAPIYASCTFLTNTLVWSWFSILCWTATILPNQQTHRNLNSQAWWLGSTGLSPCPLNFQAARTASAL